MRYALLIAILFPVTLQLLLLASFFVSNLVLRVVRCDIVAMMVLAACIGLSLATIYLAAKKIVSTSIAQRSDTNP